MCDHNSHYHYKTHTFSPAIWGAPSSPTGGGRSVGSSPKGAAGAAGQRSAAAALAGGGRSVKVATLSGQKSWENMLVGWKWHLWTNEINPVWSWWDIFCKQTRLGLCARFWCGARPMGQRLRIRDVEKVGLQILQLVTWFNTLETGLLASQLFESCACWAMI